MKTGKLYSDDDIGLFRYADGTVTLYCPSPIQIWQASGGKGRVAVVVVAFQENADGSLTEIRRSRKSKVVRR